MHHFLAEYIYLASSKWYLVQAFWVCVCKTTVSIISRSMKHHWITTKLLRKTQDPKIGFILYKEISLTELDKLGTSGKLSIVLSFPTQVSIWTMS